MHQRQFVLGLAMALAPWSPGAGFAQAIDQNLWSTNGQVNAVVRDGGTIYIGGTFTYVGPPTGSGVPLHFSGGTPVPPFPKVDGVVHAIVPDEVGGWYIGGSFTAVGGLPRTNLAHLASDLSVTAWSPNPNNAVYALAVGWNDFSGNTVYAGGAFTNIGGQPRNRIAALYATTGAATLWNANANGIVRAIALNGEFVYAAGDFTSIGFEIRNYLAGLDWITGGARSWNPNADGPVHALAVSGDGSTLYAGGEFSMIGGQARFRIAAIQAYGFGDAFDWNPIASGPVYALALSGPYVFAGGNFTTIGGRIRNHIAALWPSGSATDWNPNANAPVSAIRVDDLNRIYVGGEFTVIGGGMRNYVAMLDFSGLATPWNPNANGPVNAVASYGPLVYAGGDFTSVGGVTRNHIAALDMATGMATAWNPNADDFVYALKVRGTTVYAGGRFDDIGGQPRNGIAALDAATGAATAWNPNAPFGTIYALELSGTTVYAAGGFNNIGGQARNNIAALDMATGMATAWNPNANNSVWALALSGTTVYAGGPFTTIGGQARNHIAALDATNGAATGWNPGANGHVYALATSGNTVHAGGLFTSIGGQPRNYIAALDGTTGLATRWNPFANSGVYALALSGPTVYAGGAFTRVGGVVRNHIAAIDAVSDDAIAWNPNANLGVYALAVSGNTVYAGGIFSKMGGDLRSGIAAITAAPAIVGVHPASGSNSGTTTVTVNGHHFASGATVLLASPIAGEPDTPGSGVVVAADGRSLTASFDLRGKAQGTRHVVVVNPDLQTAMLAHGFTIESLAAPQLRVDIIGPDRIRTGYSTAYDLVIQNPGNIDALTVPLWIAGIPTNASVQPDFPLADPPRGAGEPDWSQLPDTLTSASGRYLAMVIPRVPPGTTTRRLYIGVPTPGSFQLTAALTPPWADGTQFRTCIADRGVIVNTACMGSQLTSINNDLVAQTAVQALNGIGVWAKIGWQCEGAASLNAALAEARQALDFMLLPVEQQGGIPPSCSQVLATRWRQVLTVTVGGSIDPNDKFGNRGDRSAITSQQILCYSVRFENLSGALYPAQEVVVSDVLDPDLDPSTVSLGTISFGPYRLYPPPGQSGYAASVDLRPSQNLIVNMNAILNGSTLNWYFTSVDPNGQPLPPSAGFLPPNQNPPEGEGSVIFTVRPRSALSSGTEIANSAVITFDNNPPVTTNAWVNFVDDSPPQSHVHALASPDPSPNLTVNWSADGAPSDVKDYTVCVSEDGGPYWAWRLNTTATTDTFVPRADFQPHTYAFYSVARDVVGNMEGPPPIPDAQTTSTTDVGDTGPLTLALAGARPNPAVGAAHVWFTLPDNDPAVLEVLDLAGRRVLRREVGSLGPGRHMVTLDSSPGLKSGIYFLRLAQGERVLRARMALIR